MLHGTVLVVEDEQDLREMLGDALRMHGFDVVAAVDGVDALEVLATRADWCVILLDLVMPRMDGWTFLDKLKCEPDLQQIPVIVHTSSPRRAPPTATRVLEKPVDVDRLVSIVREHCPG